MGGGLILMVVTFIISPTQLCKWHIWMGGWCVCILQWCLIKSFSCRWFMSLLGLSISRWGRRRCIQGRYMLSPPEVSNGWAGLSQYMGISGKYCFPVCSNPHSLYWQNWIFILVEAGMAPCSVYNGAPNFLMNHHEHLVIWHFMEHCGVGWRRVLLIEGRSCMIMQT